VSKDLKTYELDALYPVMEGSMHLLLGCRRGDYSASRIARAVEDCDAHLLNLNVLLDENGQYDLLADIRVNRVNGESVARSLARYGFDVISFTGGDDNADDSTMKQRVEELLRYIEM